jgi:ATP-binding cassette subfamily F protein 3
MAQASSQGARSECANNII